MMSLKNKNRWCLWLSGYVWLLGCGGGFGSSSILVVAAERLECEVYLANSTIPNAGLGLFTAVARKAGNSMHTGGDICIPLLEVETHHPDTTTATLFNPFLEHVWAGNKFGMRNLVKSPGTIHALCPGYDAAVNSHFAITNVGTGYGTYDDENMHRWNDPVAGAISPFHVFPYVNVERDIAAGGELFKSYGDTWFTSRPDFDQLPIHEHFEWANQILQKFKRLFRGKVMSIGAPKDLYTNVLLAIQSAWKTTPLIKALPNDYEDAMLAMYTDVAATYEPNTTRSIEWLQQHGKCADHILPGTSTIQEAGKGAFAKRNLPEGTIIAGSPLLHIPFKNDFFDMDPRVANGDSQDNDDKARTQQQILLNYCFGHVDTTMILCPYGNGVNYINHNQTLANVQIAWSQHGTTSQNNNYFLKAPSDFLQHKGAVLGLDYIALRDIQQGEELFLDYGDLWETAWENHSTEWNAHGMTPKDKASEGYYWSAHQWNKAHEKAPLRTMREIETDPYPSNLQLRCHTALVQEGAFQQMSATWIWHPREFGYECRIMERTKKSGDEYEYTIMLRTIRKDTSQEKDFEPEILGFAQVPRGALRFFDLPYTTDLYLQNAFRHEIGLPDELMKDSWRNSGQQSTHEVPTSVGGNLPPTTSSGGREAKKPIKTKQRHRGAFSRRATGDEL